MLPETVTVIQIFLSLLTCEFILQKTKLLNINSIFMEVTKYECSFFVFRSHQNSFFLRIYQYFEEYGYYLCLLCNTFTYISYINLCMISSVKRYIVKLFVLAFQLAIWIMLLHLEGRSWNWDIRCSTSLGNRRDYFFPWLPCKKVLI